MKSVAKKIFFSCNGEIYSLTPKFEFKAIFLIFTDQYVYHRQYCLKYYLLTLKQEKLLPTM